LDSGLFQALVDGNTSAENGRDCGQVTFLGDAGDVSGFGDAVLLKGAVDRVSREKWFRAEGFVCLLAEVT
jgi:hypothetical protein